MLFSVLRVQRKWSVHYTNTCRWSSLDQDRTDYSRILYQMQWHHATVYTAFTLKPHWLENLAGQVLHKSSWGVLKPLNMHFLHCLVECPTFPATLASLQVLCEQTCKARTIYRTSRPSLTYDSLAQQWCDSHLQNASLRIPSLTLCGFRQWLLHHLLSIPAFSKPYRIWINSSTLSCNWSASLLRCCKSNAQTLPPNPRNGTAQVPLSK